MDQSCSMADQTLLLRVSLSLVAAALLLFVGLSVCCLMKRRRRSYGELVNAPPSVPSCSAPLVLVSQAAWTTPRDIPFTLPPRLPTATHKEMKPSEEATAETKAEETHHGSLSISSRFPVGSLLSGLYPSSPLSSSLTAPPAVLPQLCFSVQYRPGCEQLLVSLLRLSNLKPSLRSRRALVELRLLPDDRRPLQAKARSTGADPEFHDCLVFQVSPLSVRSSVLVLEVLSAGADGRHLSVGRVDVPLRGDLCSTGRVLWRALQTQDNKQSSELELLVSLSYSPSVQRLSVGVSGVRGPRPTDTGVQVQVSLQSPSQLKSKRGPALKSESRPGPVLKSESRPGPVHNEEDLLHRHWFKLKPSQVQQSCVRIQVLHSHRGTTDSGVPVGVLVLGPLLFARGPQMEHWMEMLSAAGGAVERWHTLTPAS
uniref:C2 domain-containing protein n=1 Tax=Neogobius melanostomus TaxID=47308 RepID=A0A8C6UKD0_9GOBI